MVGTADILEMQCDDPIRDKVRLSLLRQDVRNCLEAMELGGADAQDSVDAMTYEKIRLLADRIDQMPTGGDALGTLLGIALMAFLILIILDIAGVTDIFTFIN